MRTAIVVASAMLAVLVGVIWLGAPSDRIESIRRGTNLIIKSERDLPQERLEATIDLFLDANPAENLRFVHRDRTFAVYTIVRSNFVRRQ